MEIVDYKFDYMVLVVVHIDFVEVVDYMALVVVHIDLEDFVVDCIVLVVVHIGLEAFVDYIEVYPVDCMEVAVHMAVVVHIVLDLFDHNFYCLDS